MRLKALLALAVSLVLVGSVTTVRTAFAQAYRQIKVISIPGVPPAKGSFSFDIGWVDPAAHRYYLADRTNNGVDIIDTANDTYLSTLAQGMFAGNTGHSVTSGPDGIVVVPDAHQLWAGDGNSSAKVIDLRSGLIVTSISTGGTKRADELAYDPRDHLIMIANDADKPPFLTFISTTTDKVMGKIPFPNSTGGLEQPVWDPASGMFYQNVPATKEHPGGEVDKIDPRAMKVVAVYPVPNCAPGGLALGPQQHFVVGCSADAMDAGAHAQTLVLDATSGRVIATITQVGGSDEVWYSPGSNQYYVAANHMTSTGMKGGTETPVLGIIDAATDQWIANVPTSAGSHSVAADRTNNQIFVPVASGIAVYGR